MKNTIEIEKKIAHHREEIRKLEKLKNFETSSEVLLDIMFEQTTNTIGVKTKRSLDMVKKSIVNKYKLVTIRKGRTITCTITALSLPNLKGVGVARCLLEDEFDVKTGSRIAELRAREDFYRQLSKRVIDRL